ncbi:Methyltransferase domain-containing protein [Nakamurella panacisegetis]|uniref:Methyltransferase domain-containing protein n=1 Tax=Nakamurella panacisegetis TaxID=1090615 RepID=A0A1H0IC05_9ACTN|nr:class I SAM-dependent methyltransferase [Nakamurella panacisegetis]SDO28938.1 Methyltransferase domain-containing protein [Nakamurella panacisegetis]
MPDEHPPPATDTEAPATLWEQQVVGERWTFYAERFDKLFAEGSDVEGEARFVDAMLPRGAAVLDAGCGTGRIANALHRMGHHSVGVDKDAGLIAIAQQRYPGVPYLACDLYQLRPDQLAAVGAPTQFDVIVLPGNVMVYMAPGSQRRVLAGLATILKPAGRLVAGFATDRDYRPSDFRADAAAIGLSVELRFSTWQMDPLDDGSGWAVIVLRAPGASAAAGRDANWAPASAWAQGAGAPPPSP